jgi:hypothetical protein
MNADLASLLAPTGVLTWPDVPRRLRPALRWSASQGQLRRLFPGVYADASRVSERDVRWRAALSYAGSRAALSHLTTLEAYELPVPARNAVHVTVPADRRLRCIEQITAHRRSGFQPEPPSVLMRGGLPVVRLERSLVESWPLLREDAQRAPLIIAIQQGLTTPIRVWPEAVAMTNLPGRAALLALLGLLRGLPQPAGDVGLSRGLHPPLHATIARTGPGSRTRRAGLAGPVLRRGAGQRRAGRGAVAPR